MFFPLFFFPGAPGKDLLVTQKFYVVDKFNKSPMTKDKSGSSISSPGGDPQFRNAASAADMEAALASAALAPSVNEVKLSAMV